MSAKVPNAQTIRKIRLAERRRIGEELHSGAAQSLSHALLLLNLQEQKKGKSDLDAVRQAVKTAINEIRRCIAELRREEPWPLFASVRDSLSDFKSRSGIPVRLKTEGKDSRIPPTVRNFCLALIQEGLHNIIKHATARSAEVELNAGPDSLAVAVKDDGIGFPRRRLRKGAAGFGLKFMKERVEQMGGKLSIESVNGRGTALKAFVPYSSSPRSSRHADRKTIRR